MIRFLTLPILLAAFATTAAAQVTLSIPLSGGDAPHVISARYSCEDGAPFDVTYINVGANSLAMIPVDGEDLIFVNVIAASGARYVSGRYEWWSKGDTAMLTDRTEETGPQDCVEADGTL